VADSEPVTNKLEDSSTKGGAGEAALTTEARGPWQIEAKRRRAERRIQKNRKASYRKKESALRVKGVAVDCPRTVKETLSGNRRGSRR